MEQAVNNIKEFPKFRINNIINYSKNVIKYNAIRRKRGEVN